MSRLETPNPINWGSRQRLPLMLSVLALLIFPATLRADHIMVVENWIVNRDSVEVQVEDFNGKLVLNLHFASSHHPVCIRLLYRDDHDSPAAKEGLRKLLEILRDPGTTSISDPELGSRLNLTFDRILNNNE